MKWLKARFTYPLIACSLLVSIGLQGIWLHQLFITQKKQLSHEIDVMVNEQSKNSLYLSLASLGSIGNERQMKAFFLSPQWQQIRIAYDNMNIYGLNANFGIDLRGDSTHVTMDFTVKNMPARARREVAPELVGLPAADVLRLDTVALPRMEKNVAHQLYQMGITERAYDKISTFLKGELIRNNVPPGIKPEYISPKYSYNFKHHYQYQLVLVSLDRYVWYRIRYYTVSSLLMILLTCAAFYYVLRLFQKQKLYADAKADFTNNMTHEFKTPIATVSIALESISKYGLANNPEKLNNYVDISRFELQRLNLMVEKVLNIHQQEAEDNRLNLELYEIQAGLMQVVAAMKLQMAKTGASIELGQSPEPFFVLGDPIHLSNVFYNLIDNAIKYGGSPLKIVIAVKQQDEKVYINFSDNGPGIATAYQDAIFDRFFRIPRKGAIHDVKGSGLGLYYVKQTIEKHGGKISVSSEVGKGSDFLIILPSAS